MHIIKIEDKRLSNKEKEKLNFFKNYNLVNDLENDPFGKILIIESETLIGFLYYSKIYDRIEINQFEILSEYRKNGYGSCLLKNLIDNNNVNITLEVNENNKEAINLYKKHGFNNVAIRKNYYGKYNGILMERVVK